VGVQRGPRGAAVAPRAAGGRAGGVRGGRVPLEPARLPRRLREARRPLADRLLRRRRLRDGGWKGWGGGRGWKESMIPLLRPCARASSIARPTPVAAAARTPSPLLA